MFSSTKLTNFVKDCVKLKKNGVIKQKWDNNDKTMHLLNYNPDEETFIMGPVAGESSEKFDVTHPRHISNFFIKTFAKKDYNSALIWLQTVCLAWEETCEQIDRSNTPKFDLAIFRKLADNWGRTEVLIAHNTVKQFDTISQEHYEEQFLYMLRNGEIEVCVTDPDGKQIVLERLGKQNPNEPKKRIDTMIGELTLAICERMHPSK